MKISIIIPPIFSVASLSKLIDSISRQSYSQYELIVIRVSELGSSHLVDSDRYGGSKIKFVDISIGVTNPLFQAFLVSRGDLIWIIDCLDEFHPDKIKLHVKLFAENPAIGGIRSGFVGKGEGNVLHSLRTVRSDMNVVDIILGDLVNFSDVIIRREWVENLISNELPPGSCSASLFPMHFFVQTLLAGCQIAGLNQAINLRYKQIDGNVNPKDPAEAVVCYLARVFENPDISLSLAKWKDKALAQAYLHWSVKAFADNETELGQRLFRNSIVLNRSILDNGAFAYFGTLIDHALQEGDAVDKYLMKNIEQLAPEFAWMSQYLNESIARAYFLKAIDEIAFARIESANQAMNQANIYGINITDADLKRAVSILSDHELAYGNNIMKTVIKDLVQLGRFVDPRKINRIGSALLINQAWKNYREGNNKAVPQKVINALFLSPRHVLNLGVSTIFFKSLFQIPGTIFHENELGRKRQSITNNFKGEANATKSKI